MGLQTRIRRIVWAAACGLIGIFLLPAAAGFGAESKDSDVSGSLDELRATDLQLGSAIAAIDAQVITQEAALVSAQQAYDAASQAVADREAGLRDAAALTESLQNEVADRAVEEYMNPRDQLVAQVFKTNGLADASRRAELLSEVAGRDRDSLSNLRAAKADFERQRKAALTARAVADERRIVEREKLDQLNAARADQARLRNSLEDRIEGYFAEDQAGAAVGGGRSKQGRASRRGSAGSDEDARISAAGMQWPVIGPIRSPFGPRWGGMHTGMDIGASEGSPIRAAKGGTVVNSGFDGGGYGNLVVIDHGNGVSTYYAHQSKIAARKGQTVGVGEVIGYVGHTGRVVPSNAGAAHLHLEIRIGGSPRDPIQYLP